MGWQFTVLSLPILFAFGVSCLTLVYTISIYRDRRRDPVVVLYFWILVAAIVWTGFSALQLLSTEPATKRLFFELLHVGAAALPPLIFLFVVAFTDRTRWLRYEVIGAVFLVPGAFILLLFFGPSGFVFRRIEFIENGLVILRAPNGPGFLLFELYSVLLVGTTVGLVLLEVRRVGSTYYQPALLIAVAVVTPMLFSLLTTANIPPFVDDRVNLVPTAAAVSVVSFGVLLYRYRLVDLPPLAYATAMKYSPDVLLVLDEDERVVSTNEHGSELLDALNGHTGAPLSEAIPEFDTESMANELVKIEREETTYYRVFVEPLTRGGRRVGRVVVLRDETEQQRQQERLQKKNEQMERFASTVSHDLRNPLNVAQGYLRIAQSECDSEELDKVESAHERMSEIIEEVLTLARTGGVTDNLEAVALTAAVERAWENVTTTTAELSVEVDRTVMADPTIVGHVFENLFRNAVEHGGADVTVTVGPLEDGFYIEDDGPGIAPENREEIFDSGYTTSPDGTGFGLSIVKQIADAHGWTCRVTEGSEGGARFEITGVEFVTDR